MRNILVDVMVSTISRVARKSSSSRRMKRVKMMIKFLKPVVAVFQPEYEPTMSDECIKYL